MPLSLKYQQTETSPKLKWHQNYTFIKTEMSSETEISQKL